MKMKRLNITAKVWLSIGIVVFGYVFTTVLGQVQGLATEDELQLTAETIFPAAQRTQEAESDFQRAIKYFSDAVMIQDKETLTRAVEAGQAVSKSLREISTFRGLLPERSVSARQLSADIDGFLEQAKLTYSSALANPANMSAEVQSRMSQVALQTGRLQTALHDIKGPFSSDLQNAVASARTRSAHQRRINIAAFFTTLCLAGVLVNIMIRRSIVGPVTHVIEGVKAAADQTADASARLAASGEAVARDAQDQAACVEETSASLEEISTTTLENAKRATDADCLMQAAQKNINGAMEKMQSLTTSMDLIAASSKEVAQVLKSIDEISFNTNILALNAAVEAARAGEAGAGFSVVADEVRALAKRAADAAKRSADITEHTIANVKAGCEYVSLVRQRFDEVAASIVAGARVVSLIATASEEQAHGVDHIGKAISRIETVTQSNAANAQQTAVAAADMKVQVHTTRKYLGDLIDVLGLRSQSRALARSVDEKVQQQV